MKERPVSELQLFVLTHVSSIEWRDFRIGRKRFVSAFIGSRVVDSPPRTLRKHGHIKLGKFRRPGGRHYIRTTKGEQALWDSIFEGLTYFKDAGAPLKPRRRIGSGPPPKIAPRRSPATRNDHW